MKNGDGQFDGLQALLKRQAALRDAIAAEKIRLQRREQKETERLESLIGRIVLAASENDAEFKARVRAAVENVPLLEGEKKLARAKGWLGK